MKRLTLLLTLVLSIAPICGAQNLLPQPNKKGLWGFVNEKGKYLIKPVYQSAEPFSSDVACVRINDRYGYINQAGQFVIPAVYDNAESFKGTYARCSKEGKYGLLTTSGAEYLDFDYDELKLSGNKLFYMGKKSGDSKVYVVVLQPTKPVIHKFDEVSESFSAGYAYVKNDGLYGYIANDGDIIKSPEYLELPMFSPNQIAISHAGSGYGIINSSLKDILPARYAFVSKEDDGNFHYGNSADSFGIVSPSGSILLQEGTYSHIAAVGNSLYTAEDASGKAYIIDGNGQAILQACDAITILSFARFCTKKSRPAA